MSALVDAQALAWDGEGLPPLGRVLGVPNEVYQHGPGVSRSGLSRLAQSPAHYLSSKFEPDKRTDAKDWGEAFHVLALQPHLWDERVAIKPTVGTAWEMYQAGKLPLSKSAKPPEPPANDEAAAAPLPRRSAGERAVWDWFEHEAAGKAHITVAQEAHVRRMVQALREHPLAGPLCEPTDLVCEVSYYWIDPEVKVLCKARTDAENTAHEVVVDLKTTIDASYTGFSKAIASYEYHCQDAHYTRGIAFAGGWKPRAFVFVAVEKEPVWVKLAHDAQARQTHAIGVYVLVPALRELGSTINRRRLQVYADCKRADVWPAYPTEIRDLDVPSWAYRDHVS